MKILSRLSIALLSVPSAIFAHPGHSALDPQAGMPHPGHEWEYIGLSALITLVAFAAVRALLKRRR